MILESSAVSPFYKNGFLLGCDDTREAIIIDPGDEIEELLDRMTSRALTVRYLLLTHAHFDHLSGLARAKRATAASIGLHRSDVFLYEAAVQQGSAFGYHIDEPPAPDFYLSEENPISFGHYDVHVHHTPGHSPGGVCLRVGKHGDTSRQTFVGDTLFAGSIGRTDLPGGDYETLIRSIRTTLFGFGDEMIVYPGHGPETTIGQERRTNPFLIE